MSECDQSAVTNFTTLYTEVMRLPCRMWFGCHVSDRGVTCHIVMYICQLGKVRNVITDYTNELTHVM